MSLKQENLQYIKEKGKFKIDCNTAIFTLEEIVILQKWGHWFRALTDGTLKPFSDKQRDFIEALKGKKESFSLEEKAWFKYNGRKNLEKKKGDSLNLQYRFDEETFYARADVKKLKSIMYSEIVKIHNE